jgi:hypothetical protein
MLSKIGKTTRIFEIVGDDISCFAYNAARFVASYLVKLFVVVE